ncbi:MAG TPA: IPTL-CTERM sorting domain-containing protein, partial [Thermoanaerobaculia bacterium]
SATIADSDYAAKSLTGQTIPSGSSTYAFSVNVTGDTTVEPTETFLVNVTNITGAVAGDTQGQGTIVNDDSPPTLSIADVPVAETNSGTTTATFTVQLSAPAQAGGVTFDITTAAGTATAGSDYVEQTLTGQTIAAGAQSATFVVTINGDTTFEPDETFTVTVSNVTGATVTDGTALGTITNDDAAPSFSIADVAITEGDAGTQLMTFTVTLSAAAASTMTVDYATADSSATVAGADYVGTSNTLTFTAGTTTQTIDVTVNGDTNVEGNEQFFVNLTNVTGGATISDAQALGVIRLDDAFAIAAVDTAYSENFDTLATTTAATTPAAWTYSETGAQANATYGADTGSSTTGNVYSYGASAASDRAFGTLQSGNLIPTIGAFYVNNTGVPITTLSFAYTGEQWRLGAASRTDRLDFQYSTDASSVSDGAATWVNVDSLDFTAPVTTSTGSKNGNVAPNRAAVAYTITGLSIAPGASFWIRWTDFNASGADDGLAIDDFSIIANIAGGVLTINDVTQLEGNAGTSIMTFTVTLSEPARAGGVTFDIATADNTATVADNDYVANSATAVTIPQGSTTYTFDVTVNGDTAEEPSQSFFVNVTNVVGALASDAQGVGTIAADDFTFVAIHDVQGNGLSSPIAGSTVTINGIVTGIKSGSSGGFFVQSADAEIDADPNTSEGIFVFTGGSVPAGAVIGNRVAVTGTVSEFPIASAPHTTTELTGTIDVSVLATSETLPAPVTITAADGAPSSNIDQYERFEGMRIAATLTVVAPTDGSINEPNATATSNGVFYAVIAGVQRPFREEGIPVTDTIPAEASCPACIPRFDNNPEKLRVDSDNQPGATQLNVVAGQTVSNVVGVLDFGFLEYTILPEAATVPVVTGPSTFTAVPTPLASELTVGALNLFHFYDTADDGPTSDVILTPTAYNERLQKASLAIRTVLKSPDVLGVIEIENLSTLSDLAARINADTLAATGTDPGYAAYLVEGSDVGGIDVGFLVKASRITVNSVTQIGATATYTNPDTNAQERLNDRPSLVLEATVLRPDGSVYPFVAIVNHTRSLIGVETDDAAGRRVRAKRAAQAEYLASYVQSRQVANPAERIILVGDFNAFAFNDGLVDVIGTIKGDPAPADEVVRPTSDLVNPNLTNLVDLLTPEQRYSYTFDGNAQTLDHALVNDDLLLDFARVAFARFDGDFPIIFYPDETRPERLSDHDGIVAFFDLNTYPGALAFSSSTYSTSEGTTTFDVTVTRSGGTDGAVSATYTISAGSAESGDFTAATGTVSFLAGETSKTFSVTINDDLLDEPDDTVSLALSNPAGGATLGAQSTATLAITDNDATPAISIGDVSVSESDGTATLTVTLTNGSDSTVTVNFATANGTATAGSDYTANSGTVTFVPGDVSESIVVTIANDTTFETSETVLVNLATPSGATISDSQGVITIANDDSIPALSINDVSFSEGAGTATISVTLTGTSSQNVTVDYATANGTASAGSDYTSTSGTLTFLPGTATQTINVSLTSDALNEPGETILVNLTNPANATISDAQGVITVTNDDAMPVLTIDDVNFTEGNAGTTIATLTVTLTGSTAQTVTVDYATANGTATAGSDYTATSGTLTFLPGTTTQTIGITVVGDAANEPDETILVNLTNPANASIGDAQGAVSVINDDGAPVLVINDVSLDENAGTATLTVTLIGTTAQTVTVDYATANGTATAGSDYTATSGTLTFNAGVLTQTIDVALTADNANEPSETILVNLTNAINATISDPQGVITINNDDVMPTLAINDLSINENSGTATLTVTLTGSTAQIVTVDYATANGSATAGSDYTGTSGTLTFNAGVLTQTIDVALTADAVNEPDETVLVNLGNPSNATISDAQGVITILNDDAMPSLAIGDLSVNENSGTATLTVTLTGSTAQTVTVDYATANGTATAGSDYTTTSGTLTFNPGVLTQTIDVILSADAAHEPDETLLVDLTNPTNATIGDTQGLVTILNDDAEPVLSIGDVTVNENAGTATVTVSLTGATQQTVTVDYATANGSATAVSDYTATSGTLTFNAGVLTQTFDIAIADDGANEATETIAVNLTNAANATTGDASGTVTIIDNDGAPTVAIGDVTVNENAGIATLSVTLSGSTSQTVSVNFATAGSGTATAGSDFTPASGTLEFPVGVTTRNIVVAIVNDSLDEPLETIDVVLSNPAAATITDDTGVITITDDDLAVADLTVAVTSSPAAPVAGGNLTFTILMTNNGPGDATAVTVVDDIPAGTTLISATASQGSCIGSPQVTCTLGDLLAGGQATVTVTVRLPQAGGSFTNNVSVDSVETDPSGATASTVIVVGGGAEPAQIPTLSEWMLLALVSALAALAALRLRA